MNKNQKNNNSSSFDELLNRAGASAGTSPEKLEQAAKEGRLNEIFKGMDKAQLSKVQNILKDREATERILNSPQAQELMRRLKGNKGS